MRSESNWYSPRSVIGLFAARHTQSQLIINSGSSLSWQRTFISSSEFVHLASCNRPQITMNECSINVTGTKFWDHSLLAWNILWCRLLDFLSNFAVLNWKSIGWIIYVIHVVHNWMWRDKKHFAILHFQHIKHRFRASIKLLLFEMQTLF